MPRSKSQSRRSRSRSSSRKSYHTPSPTMAQKEKLQEVMMLHKYVLPRNMAMKRANVSKNRKGGRRRKTHKKH